MKKLSHRILKKRKWSSLMIAASLVLSMSMQLQIPTFAATNSQLESLETKFFSHTYPKDGMEERLDRLEQMVFGEGKEGPHEPRLAKLLEAVPMVDSAPPQSQAQSQPGQQSQSQSTAQSQQDNTHAPSRQEAPNVASSDDDGSVGNYPAINAIEEKVFKKNFAKEPIANRLSRLETKILGKASTSNDLSERMDKLKQASGVDITAAAPPGSEWADDDEDIDYPSPSSQQPQYRSLNTPTSSPYVPRYGEDGRSFSGRDLRQDMNRAFGRNTAGSAPMASGNYGMSGGSSSSTSSSGSYGMGGSSIPSTSSSDRGGNLNQLAYSPRTMPPSGAPSSMPQPGQGMSSVPATAPQRGGLNQQLDALEKQILGKTYSKDGMPARLDRLEKTVFPQQANLSQISLPERVSRLLSVVPAAQQQPQAQPQQRIANKMDDDLDDDGNGIPNAPPRRGGLGKVLNSLGNMVGGFGMGSYTVSGSSMVTDPSTGYLFDQATGNLIDPASGAVVGRKTTGIPVAVPTAIPTYGYRPLNSGFVPYTTGYPTTSPYVTSPYSSPGAAVGPNSYGIPQNTLANPYATGYGTTYGASPYATSPYGTGYSTMPYANPMYGIGGTGIRFGTGFGGINMGGRWP
ncbi:MAG: hypothetical protein SFY67_17680 [Candidatus Melainabacteria bacterium]|nr:hypothetical protein [Candidatus Melainabacteria bacterium]